MLMVGVYTEWPVNGGDVYVLRIKWTTGGSPERFGVRFEVVDHTNCGSQADQHRVFGSCPKTGLACEERLLCRAVLVFFFCVCQAQSD